MIKRFPRFCGIVSGLVLMMAAGLFCDDGTGSICGRVMKPNGKPAKKASVEIGSFAIGLPRSDPQWSVTDSKGLFCFTGIRPGYYTVQADYHRLDYFYCAQQIHPVSSGETSRLEMDLKVCGFLVIDGHPVVDPSRTNLSKIFFLEDLQEVPHGSAGGR